MNTSVVDAQVEWSCGTPATQLTHVILGSSVGDQMLFQVMVMIGGEIFALMTSMQM